jgi:hypothetical protein
MKEIFLKIFSADPIDHRMPVDNSVFQQVTSCAGRTWPGTKSSTASNKGPTQLISSPSLQGKTYMGILPPDKLWLLLDRAGCLFALALVSSWGFQGML